MTAPAACLSMTIDRGVATLRFARPDKGNAYNKAMLRGLADGLTQAAEDPAIRILVLRGEGRHFCAGAEIGADAGSGDDPGIADICRRLDCLAKPTVALVQGACLGGGLALAACCDVVIAERSAFFAMPEVRLGFAPGPLMPFFLSAIGSRHARRLLVSGERFAAEEALRIGLVHRLCEPGESERSLEQQIAELLQAAPLATAEVKATLRRLSADNVTDALMGDLQAAFRVSASSPEAQEGRAAFRDKRTPRWTVR
jgi:methylglutaconyl-CoA hydratase